MQVALADAVEDSDDPALEQRKERFGGIGRDVPPDVFARAVGNRLIAAGEMLADATVARPFVRQDAGIAVNGFLYRRAQRRGRSRQG